MMRVELSIVVAMLATQVAYANSIGQGYSTCTLDGQGSCKQATAASLLQKVHQRNKKDILIQEPLPQLEEDNRFNTICTGTEALGKCWFLSELGKSCTTTCRKQNRSFSFVLPDADEPVTPQLVGHEPVTKNEAWAALECYVPSEDRYHTANRNSARLVDDIATWHHENCKLACPCGAVDADKCSWTAPQACAPEFMWKGIKYSGCATVDMEHDRPWCQHNFEHTDQDTNSFEQDWSYCSNSCEVEAPELPHPPVDGADRLAESRPVLRNKEETCTWMLADSCVKEFDYKGLHYVGCSGTDHATPWCSNTDQYAGLWNQCIYTCPSNEGKKQPVYPAVPANVPKPRDFCHWIRAGSCVPEFDYEGTHYLGCSVADSDTPWCSNTEQFKGSWNHCIYTCADNAYPVPSDEKFCTWQPNPRCAGAFQYKGVEYTGCIEEDHPTPWCSMDRVHKGSWEICTRVCSTASGSVAPVPEPPVPPVPRSVLPVPRVPKDAGEPCQRHQGEVDDTLGNSVTLDEVGFEIAAATGSTVDMKRFVCRVVEGIGCRVTDSSGLMAFVPFYSRTVSVSLLHVPYSKTYGSLESELSSLCRAGGKWVVPQQP